MGILFRTRCFETVELRGDRNEFQSGSWVGYRHLNIALLVGPHGTLFGSHTTDQPN
jgi:hypothetical protein